MAKARRFAHRAHERGIDALEHRRRDGKGLEVGEPTLGSRGQRRGQRESFLPSTWGLHERYASKTGRVAISTRVRCASSTPSRVSSGRPGGGQTAPSSTGGGGPAMVSS